MRFQGKVALVTGGSSGMGAETCVRLAEEGAQVAVVASSSLERAQATVDRCGGENAKPFACDVSDVAKVEKLVADVMAAFGKIDILVNAAGVFYPTRIGETDEGMFDEMCDINLKGCFFMCNAVAQRMIPAGGGKIVNLASAAGTAGRSNYIVYSAVKAGVINMTRSLAVALAPHDINVNCVAPGNTATPMNENVRTEPEYAEIYQTILDKTASNRPFAPAREMAGAILFLCSEDAQSAHGAMLLMDEGVSAGY